MEAKYWRHLCQWTLLAGRHNAAGDDSHPMQFKYANKERENQAKIMVVYCRSEMLECISILRSSVSHRCGYTRYAKLLRLTTLTQTNSKLMMISRQSEHRRELRRRVKNAIFFSLLALSLSVSEINSNIWPRISMESIMLKEDN